MAITQCFIERIGIKDNVVLLFFLTIFLLYTYYTVLLLLVLVLVLVLLSVLTFDPRRRCDVICCLQ